MFFLNSKAARKGYKRQDELIPIIEEILERDGYPCSVQKSSMNEDCREHIDAKIKLSSVPFKGYYILPIDIKTGKTLTLIDGQGKNTLDHSKSIFLVYEMEYSSKRLIWIGVKKLNELVKEYKPKLYNSKFGKSKYFWCLDFVDDHYNEFKSDEYFFLKK